MKKKYEKNIKTKYIYTEEREREKNMVENREKKYETK